MKEVLDENEQNNNEQKMELSKSEEMVVVEGRDEYFGYFLKTRKALKSKLQVKFFSKWKKTIPNWRTRFRVSEKVKEEKEEIRYFEHRRSNRRAKQTSKTR